MKYKLFGHIVALLIIVVFAATSVADDKAGEEINWQVISGGGSNNGTSTNYQLSGTVAQTAVGAGNSTNYGLSHGYWQDFGGGAIVCDCTPGNANGDALTNIFDVTFVISFLYKGGPPPTPYPICSGDPEWIGMYLQHL